jgi:hypothetical protein
MRLLPVSGAAITRLVYPSNSVTYCKFKCLTNTLRWGEKETEMQPDSGKPSVSLYTRQLEAF